MPENEISSPVTAPTEVGKQGNEIFPSQPTILLCSWFECLGGHRWPATLASPPCPTCKGSVIAIKKENCPYCNEPQVRMSFRADQIVKGGGLTSRCKGDLTHAESMDIQLESQIWRESQSKATTFEQRVNEENAKLKTS